MKKSKKKPIIIIAIVIVLIIVAISIVRCSSTSVPDDTAMYSGILVEPLAEHDLSTSISVSGTTESQEKTSVTSDLTYKIAQLNVAVGDYVNAGDVLCVFDASELQAQIKTLEDQLNNADTLTSKQSAINNRALNEAKEEKTQQLNTAQAAIDNAQSAYDNAVAAKSQLTDAFNECRKQISDVSGTLALCSNTESEEYLSLQEKLSDLTVSSNTLMEQLQEADTTINTCKQALDAAKTNYSTVEKTADQQIQSAQDTIDTQGLSTDNADAKKELETLKRKLDKITVKAENSGIITSLNVSNGSIHAGGELMTIQNTNALKLTVTIKESDILKLKEGMKAIVTSNADESKEIEGTVSKVVDFVSGSSAPSQDGQTTTNGYSAEITLPDNCGLLLGMSAKAKILVSDEEKSLAVSYDSIIDEDGNSYVYKAVADSNGKYKIEKVKVTKGTDSTYYTGITSDDLAEGDYIVSYPDSVTEGELVDIDETYLSGEDGE